MNSVLNLLSLYHDTLLARRLALVKSTSKVASELIPPSPHTRYTRAWSEKDGLYRWSAQCLEVIRFTQLVMEMLLKRVTQRKGRWRGIMLLELTKWVKISIFCSRYILFLFSSGDWISTNNFVKQSGFKAGPTPKNKKTDPFSANSGKRCRSYVATCSRRS